MKLLQLLASLLFLPFLLLFLLLPGLLLHLLPCLVLRIFLLSEELEDVLVVEERVRELVLEVLVVEELRDPPLDQGHLQDRIDGWPLRRVLLQERRYQVIQRRAVLLGDLVKLSLDDALGKLVEGGGVEGRAEGAHLVEEDTQGPHV